MRTGEVEVKNDCGVQIYKVIYPENTTISAKNLKNAVDFHPDQREPCKNSWYQDLRSTHIRNKRLLDLPRKYPKCCNNIYNMVVDRQKLKKLQKYGLSRPVRTWVSKLQVEQVEKCKAEVEGSPAEIVPVDCVQIPEIDSDDDDDDDDDDNDDDQEEEDKYWLAEADRRCSECYIMNERRRKTKVDWRDLLHGSEEEYCKGVVREVMKKYKGRLDAELKLKVRT